MVLHSMNARGGVDSVERIDHHLFAAIILLLSAPTPPRGFAIVVFHSSMVYSISPGTSAGTTAPSSHQPSHPGSSSHISPRAAPSHPGSSQPSRSRWLRHPTSPTLSSMHESIDASTLEEGSELDSLTARPGPTSTVASGSREQ